MSHNKITIFRLYTSATFCRTINKRARHFAAPVCCSSFVFSHFLTAINTIKHLIPNNTNISNHRCLACDDFQSDFKVAPSIISVFLQGFYTCLHAKYRPANRLIPLVQTPFFHKTAVPVPAPPTKHFLHATVFLPIPNLSKQAFVWKTLSAYS